MTAKTRQELASELLAVLQEARQRVGLPSLSALLGNEIRICDYRPLSSAYRRIVSTYKVLPKDDMEAAIEYVRGMCREDLIL